jgi:hypothetical protein
MTVCVGIFIFARAWNEVRISAMSGFVTAKKLKKKKNKAKTLIHTVHAKLLD